MDIGKTISHYTILERLGGGGMGVVFKAEDTKLKRTVALKFLPNDLTRDLEAKQRFIREAQAASALQHDNICTIHDIDEGPEGELFIVMDYYDGETLKKKIERGPLPVGEAIDVAMQVCRGLAKAHAAGMVHRDIKPANIMVTREGEAKIVDFGIAKLAGRTKLTKTGSTTGTVSYMSPEQANGETVDHRTDIWSMGATLYEMIAGRSPFRGDYENAVLYSIVNESPSPLTAVRSDVPMDLERVVEKALAKDPRDRYQHVDDLVVDLRRLQGESVSQGMTASARPPARRKASALRKFAVISGLGGGAAAVLLFLVPALQDQMLASNPIPVAVITFENQTGDEAYDYLAEAIPNLLITNLEQSRYLRVATWERLRDLMKQMGKEDQPTISSELGIELCRRGGIDVIVVGRYTKAGEMFATDVKVLDVDTKEILKSTNSKGKGIESILENQIDDLSREIASGAGLTVRRVAEAPLGVSSITTNSMDAYNFYLRGKADYHRFYYDDAKRFLERALALDSTFAAAHAYLAFTLFPLNQSQEAMKEISAAMHYAPRASERERLFIEGAYAWNVLKDRVRGIALLREAVEKYPNEKEARRWLGLLYRTTGAYELAIVELQKALELDPEFADALNELGYAYAHLGQYDKAIECFQRQVVVRPGDANPLDSMAELYFRMGKLDEAVSRYKEVLEIRPDFYSSYLALGYTLALRGDLKEAQSTIGRFILLASSAGLKAEGYCDRALVHLYAGRLRAALVDLDSAQQFAEGAKEVLWSARARLIASWIRLVQGDYDHSRRILQDYYPEVLSDDPSRIAHTLAQQECSWMLLDISQRRSVQAASRLQTIDSLMPYVGELRAREIRFQRDLLYAEVLLAQDSAAKALELCDAAGKLETPTMSSWGIISYNRPLPRDTRARACLALGDREGAIREYEQIVEFDSASWDHRIRWPKYRISLARLLEEVGQYAKAKEQYVQFLESWKDADRDLPEIAEATKRLASLRTH